MPSLRRCLLVLIVLACCASPSAQGARVLMVTNNNGSLTGEEAAHKASFEAWGHSVTTVWDKDSPANYQVAMDSVDVVYIPEDVLSSDIGYKLRTTTLGVVSEEPALDDEMGFSTKSGGGRSGSAVTIADNTHPITSGYATGPLTITTSNRPLIYVQSPVAPGAQWLSTYSGKPDLLVLETGAALVGTYSGNSTASGRRVRLPWGGDSFAWSSLSSEGLTLVKNAIEWAASGGPVAHWRLDELSGTTLADSSHNALDASFATGDPAWADGARGGALEFNGGSDAKTNASFDPPANGTVAFWCRFNAAPTGAQRLLGLSDAWEVWVDATGTLYADLGGNGSGGGLQTPIDSASAGKWRHFVALYSSDEDSFKLYLDGKLVASGSMPLADHAAGILSLDARTGSGERFNGALDDIRIYNYPITEQQIAQLYGLVGHWKLDEPSGTIVADSSGAGNHGVYEGATLLAEARPYPGVNAARFDAPGAYVRVPHADTLTVSNTLTLAAWVRRGDDSSVESDIIAKRQAGGDAAYRMFIDSDGKLRLVVSQGNPGLGSGEWQGASAASIDDEKWRHVAVSYDGATVTWYINGRIDRTEEANFVVGDAGFDISVGGFDDNWLSGAIYDARVYNRAITPQEVASLYGLIGHWKLDETGGSIAEDSSPFENHGDYQNGPQLGKQGSIDRGVEFDGFNDRVVIADSPAYSSHTTTGLTAAAWVKVLKLNTDSHGQTRQPIVAKGLSPHWEWALYSYDNGGAGFSTWRYGGSSHSEISGGALPIGAWKHVVGTYQPGVGTRLYVDGVLVKEGKSLSGVPYDGGRPLTIGAREDHQYLNAVIDDVRVYHRLVSEEEIKDLAGAATPHGIRIMRWVEVR